MVVLGEGREAAPVLQDQDGPWALLWPYYIKDFWDVGSRASPVMDYCLWDCLTPLFSSVPSDCIRQHSPLMLHGDDSNKLF